MVDSSSAALSEMRILVRAATGQDDALIGALAQESRLSVRAGDERNRIQARLWVAEAQSSEGASFAGFALCWVVCDEIEVLDVAVMKERRSQGIGATLLRFALAQARGEGCRTAFLEVRRKNIPAQALYRACGFEFAYERSAYYSDGEDALIFRCCLDGQE